MEHLFIDESGTMTVKYSNHPYFVICIVRAKDTKKLKKTYKRFVSKYMNKLKSADNGRNVMFKNDAFVELKGNCFTPELKRIFVDFFCRGNHFEVFYIVAHNTKITSRLYDNTARAFNYLLKIALEFFINNNYISNEGLYLQLDERNEKTETKHFLENYINTELYLQGTIEEECRVSYYDSANNIIIQLADVFANLYFSELKTGNYTKEFKKMKANDYIKFIFKFPLK